MLSKAIAGATVYASIVLAVALALSTGLAGVTYADQRKPPPPNIRKHFAGVHGSVDKAKTANRPWLKKGYYAPHRRNALVFVRKTAKTEDFVRVYAKGKGQRTGDWLVKARDIRGLTPKQIQAKLSLLHLPTHFVHARVEKNTRISQSTAAGKRNSVFGRKPGGLKQFHAPKEKVSFSKSEFRIGDRFN